MHFDVMWKYVCRFKHKIFIFIIFNVENTNMDDENDQKKKKWTESLLLLFKQQKTFTFFKIVYDLQTFFVRSFYSVAL